MQCYMWCTLLAAEDPWVQWIELGKWTCRWLQGAYRMQRADLVDRCGWQVLLTHIGLLLIMLLLREICTCMLQAANLLMPADCFLLQHFLYSWLQVLVVTRPLCDTDCLVWLILGAMLMIQAGPGLRTLRHQFPLLWTTGPSLAALSYGPTGPRPSAAPVEPYPSERQLESSYFNSQQGLWKQREADIEPDPSS